MGERMIGVRVSITHYISDEPQPGIVECELTDAHGRRWSFVQKTAYVSFEDLDSKTSYPRLGVIECIVLGRSRDANGREVVLIDTEEPESTKSTDGTTRFEVLPEALVEWNWGSYELREWDSRP
jgi:hypothetical protein